MIFFRTDRTGAAVFAQSANLAVWRIGPYEGAIAEATGGWGPGGILLVSVTADVGEWLSALP